MISLRIANRMGFDVLYMTDARTFIGLDETLRRGEAYARAGADILFIESPESEEEMARIGRTFNCPSWPTWWKKAVHRC
ncbi:MAG: hypothetical protein KatS3mg123_2035 [Burkholderiales bacterium]|nr:MAG: hypothetical protein KatS3mg123_2035 [Burkholderiales bacterium]